MIRTVDAGLLNVDVFGGLLNVDYIDPYVCSIDPVTLGGLAIGALAGGAGSFFGGGGGSSPAAAPAAPAPQAPPAAAPASAPSGQKGTPKAQTPSFLGAPALPSQSGYGSKTLLGQ